MLTDADKEDIVRRLIFLQDELNDYHLYRDVTWDEYQNNRSKRRELERWVENITNCTIDISKVVLGSLDLLVPETYRDTLKSLECVKGFKKGIGEKLSSWAKLRNVLAHEYLDIRWESVKSFLKDVDTLANDFVKSINSVIENKT